jgi:hypothetical protein
MAAWANAAVAVKADSRVATPIVLSEVIAKSFFGPFCNPSQPLPKEIVRTLKESNTGQPTLFRVTFRQGHKGRGSLNDPRPLLFDIRMV